MGAAVRVAGRVGVHAYGQACRRMREVRRRRRDRNFSLPSTVAPIVYGFVGRDVQVAVRPRGAGLRVSCAGACCAGAVQADARRPVLAERGIWGKLRDKGFKDEDLKAIGESMSPGTSAIIAIAEDRVVERLETAGVPANRATRG